MVTKCSLGWPSFDSVQGPVKYRRRGLICRSDGADNVTLKFQVAKSHKQIPHPNWPVDNNDRKGRIREARRYFGKQKMPRYALQRYSRRIWKWLYGGTKDTDYKLSNEVLSSKFRQRDITPDIVRFEWFSHFAEFLSGIPVKVAANRRGRPMFRRNFLLTGVNVSGLAAAILVMRQYDALDEMQYFFEFDEEGVASDIRGRRLATLLGRNAIQHLLRSIFEKLESLGAYETQLNLLRAGKDLLVAYLCRDDTGGFRDSIGATIEVKLKSLYDILGPRQYDDDLDQWRAESGNIDSDLDMEAVKAGMIFGAMVGFGSDVQTKATEKDAKRNAGVTGVVKEGASAATAFNPVFNAVTNAVVKATGEYVGQRFDRLSKARTKKIAWFMTEVTDKFNAQVIGQANYGQIRGLQGGRLKSYLESRFPHRERQYRSRVSRRFNALPEVSEPSISATGESPGRHSPSRSLQYNNQISEELHSHGAGLSENVDDTAHTFEDRVSRYAKIAAVVFEYLSRVEGVGMSVSNNEVN